MAKHKQKRRIKSAAISLISLVPRGSNGVASIVKGEKIPALVAFAKAGVDGYLYTLVYAPNQVDDQGDVADAATVRQMAHDFLLHKQGTGIDVLHSCEPLEPSQARICETFIVQKGDPRFAGIKNDDGTPLDPTGAWGLVIKIEDAALKAKYAAGEWVGVSMYGTAEVESLGKASDRSSFPNQQPEVHEVDETKLAAALDAALAKREKALVEALVKAFNPEAPKAPEVVKIVFEGDPCNPEDLEKHEDKVLFASLDFSKTADIAKWRAHLEKKAALKKAAEKGANPNQSKIEELEAELKKLRGAPAPTSGEGTGGGEGQKTTSELLKAASDRAKELKKAGVIR